MRDLNSVFDSIIELKDNWNGYGAKSFNKVFVDKCREIVKGLKREPFVAPTANNSIQIEYEGEKGYLEIELFGETAKVFKLSPNNQSFSFTLLNTDSTSLNFIIDSFYS